MRGELLFKGEGIVKAFSNEDFSRFMIAPRRRVTKGNGKEDIYNGSVAIAAGRWAGSPDFLMNHSADTIFSWGVLTARVSYANISGLNWRTAFPLIPCLQRDILLKLYKNTASGMNGNALSCVSRA